MCLFQALSGVGETIQVRARILDNTALTTALNTQFLLQIGIFTAVPMILGFILEQGFLRVIFVFLLGLLLFPSLFQLSVFWRICRMTFLFLN